MLYARVLRSPHPHARIRSIDVSAATAVAGVKAVITHDNCMLIGFSFAPDRHINLFCSRNFARRGTGERQVYRHARTLECGRRALAFGQFLSCVNLGYKSHGRPHGSHPGIIAVGNPVLVGKKGEPSGSPGWSPGILNDEAVLRVAYQREGMTTFMFATVSNAR